MASFSVKAIIFRSLGGHVVYLNVVCVYDRSRTCTLRCFNAQRYDGEGAEIVKLHQVASFFFDDDNSNRNIMRSAQLLACFRQRLSTDMTKNVAEKSNTAAPTRLHQLCIVW